MAIKYFVGDKLISAADVPAYSGRQIVAYCVSTDTKPVHMGDCDILYEKDTKKTYIYDAGRSEWMEM